MKFMQLFVEAANCRLIPTALEMMLLVLSLWTCIICELSPWISTKYWPPKGNTRVCHGVRISLYLYLCVGCGAEVRVEGASLCDLLPEKIWMSGVSLDCQGDQQTEGGLRPEWRTLGGGGTWGAGSKGVHGWAVFQRRWVGAMNYKTLFNVENSEVQVQWKIPLAAESPTHRLWQTHKDNLYINCT